MDDPITKMVYDAIWRCRPSARKLLVKKVAENSIEDFKKLKEDGEDMKKVIKSLKYRLGI